jgi:hypothetical protein
LDIQICSDFKSVSLHCSKVSDYSPYNKIYSGIAEVIAG